jgi:hypothetical protein
MPRVSIVIVALLPVASSQPAVERESLHPISWRQEFGGLKSDQVKRLKELETENGRLRRAVSDLTLDKLILREAARGNF